MAKSAIVQRVERRLTDLGVGAVEAAARVPGLERNYIRDLLQGKKRSFSESKLPMVAQALNWTVQELRGEQDDGRPVRRERVAQVPLLSWVSAGQLVDAESQILADDFERLAFAGLGRGEFFALKVEGDSMDRLSPEGSVIVVNRMERDAVVGRAYVFWHRTEGTTYKLWHADPDYLEPFSTNPAHKPIFVKRKKDLEIVGRVRRTVLDL